MYYLTAEKKKKITSFFQKSEKINKLVLCFQDLNFLKKKLFFGGLL